MGDFRRRWTERIDTAERELAAWYARAGLSLMSGAHADSVWRAGSKLIARARDRLDAAGVEYDVSRVDAVLSPLVAGVYELMAMPAPTWSDPVRDSVIQLGETVTGAADAVRRGAGGFGVGLGLALAAVVAWKVLR